MYQPVVTQWSSWRGHSLSLATISPCDISPGDPGEMLSGQWPDNIVPSVTSSRAVTFTFQLRQNCI